MARLWILTGAPPSTVVGEADPSELLGELNAAVAQFAGVVGVGGPTSLPSTGASWGDTARWRSLPLDKHQHLATGFSQLYDAELLPTMGSSPGFFNTTSLSFAASSDAGTARTDSQRKNHKLLSQFYEHSRAIHDDVPSSQLEALSDGETDESSSFVSADTSLEISGAGDPRADALEGRHLGGITDGGHLSDLEDLPSAAYLLKAAPATVSVSLIVGIISIAPPRTVTTRWGDKRLVEVLVGDDSRSGFQITFWLDDVGREKPGSKPSGPGRRQSDARGDDLEAVLRGLRPQDIILAQNVGLNVFMRRVYGSSLRRRLTKVHLFHRTKLDADDHGGYYSRRDLSTLGGDGHPQMQKTRRVRDWVLRFVGPGGAFGGRGVPRAQSEMKRPWDQPPPDDTQ